MYKFCVNLSYKAGWFDKKNIVSAIKTGGKGWFEWYFLYKNVKKSI